MLVRGGPHSSLGVWGAASSRPGRPWGKTFSHTTQKGQARRLPRACRLFLGPSVQG